MCIVTLLSNDQKDYHHILQDQPTLDFHHVQPYQLQPQAHRQPLSPCQINKIQKEATANAGSVLSNLSNGQMVHFGLVHNAATVAIVLPSASEAQMLSLPSRGSPN